MKNLLDNKKFINAENTANGEVSGENTFTMFYHHLNQNDEVRAGQCHTKIRTEPNGKLTLIESWQWLNGDCSKGQSVLTETI